MGDDHEELRLRLTGVAPLLMRCGQLADPLNPHSQALHRITSKRLKTLDDHRNIARIEWRAGLWLSGGRPCIPAEAIEAAMVAGAKHRRMGLVMRSAVIVRDTPILVHTGPEDLDDLYQQPAFVHRCGVRISNRTAMRSRPRFDDWSVEVTLSYLPSAVDWATLLEIAQHAGAMTGLGDYRPKFGRFVVERLS